MFFQKQKFPVGQVAAAFGLGAIAGSAVALLFTPLTGKKMQKKLANAAEDLVENVQEKFEDVQAQVRKITRA